MSDIIYFNSVTGRPIEVPPGASLGDRLQQALTNRDIPVDLHIDMGRRRRPRHVPALFEDMDEPKP